MKVALGFKAHSGWAAMVAVGDRPEGTVVDRRRIALVGENATWAKAPYHAAEEMAPKRAAELVEKARREAERVSVREMRRALDTLEGQGHAVVACAILMPNPMPPWSVEEIRAVHIRMHQAEGILFPEALAKAAESCGLRFVPVNEKSLDAADEARLNALAKMLGPPWGKDQKNAARAAMIALRHRVVRAKPAAVAADPR